MRLARPRGVYSASSGVRPSPERDGGDDISPMTTVKNQASRI